MWVNSGKFAKSYLEGHRKDKQPPVSFLVVWGAVFYLVRQALIYLFSYKMEAIKTFTFIDQEAAPYYFKHVSYFLFSIAVQVLYEQ